MSDDLKSELKELKEAVNQLQARVEHLESARAEAGADQVIKVVASESRKAAEEPVMARVAGETKATAGNARFQQAEAPKVVLTGEQDEPSLPAVADTGDNGGQDAGAAGEPDAQSRGAVSAGSGPEIIPNATPAKASLESRIGQIWLNRIGIASLVIGMAFLLMYSFQYFGAQAKLACGALISFALIGLGEWTGRKKGTSWFGSGLIGGGWALAYFTAYASHFVQSVQVVNDATVGGVLMLATALGAMGHAVWRKAQEIANLSIVLGYITVALTAMSPVSLWSNLGLLGATCALSVKMKWHRLLLYSTIASYLVVIPHFQNFDGTTAFGVSESLVSMGLLFVYWLAYMISGTLISKGTDGKNPWVIAAGLVNAFSFTIGYFVSLNSLVKIGQGDAVDAWKFPATIGIAAVYGAFSYVCGKLKEKGLAALYMVLGVFTATISLLLKFEHNTTLLFSIWAMEAAILAWSGLKYQIHALRRFAYGLALVVNVSAIVAIVSGAWITEWTAEKISENLILPLVAIACSAAVAWCYQAQLRLVTTQEALDAEQAEETKLRAEQAAVARALAGDADADATAGAELAPVTPPALPIAKTGRLETAMLNLGFHSYFLAVTILCWFLPIELGTMMQGHVLPNLLGTHPEKLNVFWWAFESATIVALGLRLSAPVLRVLGVLGFVSTVLAMLVLQPGVVAVTVVAGMLFATAWLYHKYKEKVKLHRAGKLWSLSGVGVMTLVLPGSLPTEMLAPYWAVEGLALLVAGFRLRDKTLRFSGLLAFVLLVGKLLLVDLAAADTLQRIISFIVAGQVLLASSYGYAQFTKKLEQQENPGS
jgi:uncharacterized membrane protein